MPAQATDDPGSDRASRPFPIVAIGASAGGLEALEQFLGQVPADAGMACVVIQHLDPHHKGMMPELLQRATTMPVVQAKNRMKVKPGGVYVIPPNWDLSILHDTLYLLEPVAARGLLNEMLELLPVGVWLIDSAGNIVRSNAAGRRIWAGERCVGLDRAGEYKGWWLHSGQRIEAAEWAGARAIMKGETSIDEEIEIECFDGTHKIILNSAMPLSGGGSAVRGAIFVNQDITARWHAENRVRELAAMLETRVKVRTAELEEANRELDAFNFSVSHDLRTPLRAIEGFSRALLEDCHEQLDETGRDYLRRICSSTVRMGELIEALYELSRLSRAPLQLHPVDLSALARELVAELRELDPQRKVDIEIADTPPVEGDARLLRIVLANLLGNAWKFTAKTASARIAFDAQRGEDGCMVYRVVDNGAGFDMQFADKLFRIFHRLHREEEFTGQGVGLTTAQRVIARHGGSVWGDGEKGRGASFCFTLWGDPALLAEAREAADSA